MTITERRSRFDTGEQAQTKAEYLAARAEDAEKHHQRRAVPGARTHRKELAA